MPAALPESDAGARVLLVRVGRELFAFPLAEVLEVVEAPAIVPLALLPDGVVGQVEHRAQLVPVLDAGRLLGARRASSTGGVLLLVRLEAERVALWADDVVDVAVAAEAALRPVPAGGAEAALLRGVVQLAGGVAAVVEMQALRAAVRARLTAEVG